MFCSRQRVDHKKNFPNISVNHKSTHPNVKVPTAGGPQEELCLVWPEGTRGEEDPDPASTSSSHPGEKHRQASTSKNPTVIGSVKKKFKPFLFDPKNLYTLRIKILLVIIFL